MRIVVRDDGRVRHAGQLLLRMNDDRDVTNAVKLALANAGAYRVVPGYQDGALAISCFAVASDADAAEFARATRWSRYGLARVADLLALDCQLIGTDVYDGADLLPFSDRHVDVITCAYPPGVPPYAELPKAERARLRANLCDRINTVLRVFDPRYTVSGQLP